MGSEEWLKRVRKKTIISTRARFACPDCLTAGRAKIFQIVLNAGRSGMIYDLESECKIPCVTIQKLGWVLAMRHNDDKGCSSKIDFRERNAINKLLWRLSELHSEVIPSLRFANKRLIYFQLDHLCFIFLISSSE